MLIGAICVAALVRERIVGRGMPQGLETLVQRAWGNDSLSIFAAALLVLNQAEARGRRWTTATIATYVFVAGLAAYPAVAELVAHASPLRAAVRSLPVLLAAALMYLGLAIKDRIMRRRARGPHGPGVAP